MNAGLGAFECSSQASKSSFNSSSNDSESSALPPSSKTHEISYTSPPIESFLKSLENGSQIDFQDLDSEKCTILISVLLGKLLLQEIPLINLQHSHTLKNIQQVSSRISFLQIAKSLNFGTRRWDANHALLKKKITSMRKKEKKDSLSLGFDMSHDERYASFCDIVNDEAFHRQMAMVYDMGNGDAGGSTLAGGSSSGGINSTTMMSGTTGAIANSGALGSTSASGGPGGTPLATHSASSTNLLHQYPTAQNATYPGNSSSPSDQYSSSQTSGSAPPPPRFSSPFSQETILERANILYTLTMLVLFFPYDSENASLLTLLETWVQARSEAQQQMMHPNPSTSSDGDFIPDHDIQAPSDLPLPLIQFQSDFQLVSNLDTSLPELDQMAPFCVADSLLYLKLRDMAQDPSLTNDILEQFLVLLKRPERNLVNLFTFLNFLLPNIYITKQNLEKVQEIMLCAKQQFMEPLPVGGLAKSILLTCKRKLLHFGSIERDNFLSSLQKTKHTIEGITREKEPVFRRRTVYVLYNRYSQNASHLDERLGLEELESSSPSVEDDSDIVHSMANLLLNIFEEAGLLDEYLERIPQRLLSKYFYSTYIFLKEIENGERPESKRDLFLDNLKETLVTEGGELYNNPSDTPVRRQRCPPLPKPHLTLVHLPKEVELETCKKERRIFPRSCVVDALQKIITESEENNALTDDDSKLVINVAVAGGSGSLQRLAHSLVVANRLHLDKPIGKKHQVDLQVYMIPLGVNNHLSTWLEKHDPFYSRYWHMPMVSPISAGRCTMGACLAGRDSPPKPFQSQVFERKERTRKSFLYNPVHTYRADAGNEDEDVNTANGSTANTAKQNGSSSTNRSLTNSPLSIPHAINNRLLNHYLNEARTKLPVHVYTAQCLCYDVSKRDLRNRDSTTPNALGGTSTTATMQRGNSVVEYISLSFCQRLDIGIVAEAAQMIQKNDEFKNMRMEDVIAHKDFKFQGHQLSVSYVPMDPSGLTPSSQIIEKPSLFHSICVKSTSIPGDQGAMASPVQPWLEVFSEDTLSQKRKAKLREEDQSANSHHVAQLIVDSATAGKFNILMDGEVYGPYHKIIIARDNKVKSFNMMSFDYRSLRT